MGFSIADRLKGFVSARILEQLADAAASSDPSQLARVFDLIASFSPSRYHRETFREGAEMARQNHPFIQVFKRIFVELDPNCRQKFIMNLLVNWIVLGRSIREREEARLGVHLPNLAVISPTMRCNLNCRGCYAGNYAKSEELSFEELDRILNEAKELGMYFFTFTGGECFIRPDLLDLWEKHDDCYFQVYTNGTLIDDVVAERLRKMGNVAPMISIEGTKADTDARRGEGIYEKVMETFDRLKKYGILYGFSATYTRESAPTLSSDAFIEEMIEKGCKAGWFFQYIPTGKAPELGYMATPEQRAALHAKVMEWRSRYPIFLGDFWNDGPYVDGCMAGGQRYFHIIANGDVEPCVFCHFAVDNIREKSLVEILKSPFFTAIRKAQPFEDDNLLRPCMIIDHPHIMRELVKHFGAHPTHPGSEGILDSLDQGLDEYAKKIKEIYDPLWEASEREKYLKSLEKEDDESVHERFRRPSAKK